MDAIKTRLQILVAILAVLIIIGTLGFMIIEGRTFLDAFYFVIVTMATVGYGDVHPVTSAGKILTMLVIILGVGTFLGVIANVTEIMLARREIESRMEKLNMVIGVFFSEVGLHLLSRFARYDSGFEDVRSELVVTGKWTEQNFNEVSKRFRDNKYDVQMENTDLADLKTLLCGSRDFLVRLLENPNLLEHETFTDLLRAVFHLTEELAYRDQVTELPPADMTHLAWDIKRVFHLLVSEWLDYMKYLKNNYPFLFSLAMRTNPFDKAAKVVVMESH